MDSIDAVVIGAGVIGLAVARELAMAGHETLILEAERGIGAGASSRNSEVIHAGLYYAPGSLKARLCVAGRERLYEFCRTRNLPAQRLAKLIVAGPTQLPELEHLAANARANGVELEWLDGSAARALEPELTCAGALHSPLSGILDAHDFMLALLAEAEAHGATLACRSRVTRLVPDESGIAIGVNGADPALRARRLINSAGVQAPEVAGLIEGFPAQHIPRTFYSKGNYFSLRGRAPFRRLIYPLPESQGLGIHLTLDLAGRARFGPDVERVDRSDFTVDPRRAPAFYEAIRRYWRGLPDGALEPAYAGMRARIYGPGESAADFRIDGALQHGMQGVLNLFGIESPGLTASLAIASEAASRIG
ncbi:MAG: NAD(P)/FAD-dependent oxidoreductase [Gammaproteobacteria bacterium]|nr:NAD(P)/FAD-dependent oxidoreductase [Gammaproteobacteria bacterium]